MKRFYNYFLSLFLLSLVGITSAVAQGFKQGDLVTSIDDITGETQVLIYAPGGVTSDAPAGYLNGTSQFTETLSNACLYNIIPTGETTSSGYKTYYLKQVSTGLYVKDLDLSAANDDDAEFEMTADQSEAYKCTVLEVNDITGGEAGTDEDALRRDATSAKQDLSETAFTFARHDFDGLGEDWDGHVFIGHVYSPFWSPYTDTNAFRIYKAEATVGKEKLESYVEAYFSTVPAEAYPAGTTPGTYNESYVNNAQTIYEKAQAALSADEFTMSNDDVDALCEDIAKAMTALTSADAFNDVVPGYYFIKNVTGRYLYSNVINGTDFLYGSASSYALPETLTSDEIKYLWKVTEARDPETNLVSIQNVVTGTFMGGPIASVSGPDTGHGFTLTSDGQVLCQKTTCDGNADVFALISQTADSNGHKGYHGKYDNTAVFGWNNLTGSHNCYKFIPANITAEDIEALRAEAVQKNLNSSLKTAYDAAQTTLDKGYTKSYSFTSSVKADDDFTAEGALVPQAADEASASWWSNAKSSAEGSYAALTDGDLTTYFHSDWNSAFTPDENGTIHYLVATLSEPVANGIVAKLAKRATLHDYPTQFAIYGSNDFDSANPDAATWTKQGVYDVSWTIKGDSIGIVACPLDGTYQYIKFAATKTQFSTANTANTRGYFAISEMNVWAATDVKLNNDPTPEMQEVISAAPEALKALETELANAKAQLDAEKATQEQIDALNAAVEEFNNNYPNPSRVTTAYNAAKTFLDNANTNGLIGADLAQYPQDAATALQAVLDEYASFDKVSLAEINAAVEAINSALATFKGTIQLPEAGKLYTIRSASKKIIPEAQKNGQGYVGALYRAIVYSADNNASTELSDAASSIHFYRLNGSDDIAASDESAASAPANEGDLANLKDSVQVEQDARIIWKAETAENGQIVLRNLGTGMYLTAANGKVYQSVEATPLNVEGIAANTFRFNAGVDANGNTQYMNTKGATSTVVTWKDASDENSNWYIESVTKAAADLYSFCVNDRKVGQFYIGTFPVAVEGSDATIFDVVGVNTTDNKLVLAENSDGVAAGTPFIYRVDGVQHADASNESTVGLCQFNLTFDAGNFTTVEYTLTPAETEGAMLSGTLTSAVKIAAPHAYLNNGAVAAVTGTNEVTIGTNSGYFNYVAPTEEAGDAELDLNKAALNALTGVDQANVVVLPSVVDVYTVNGQLVRKGVKANQAAKNLPAGVYVIGGVKVLVK